MSKSAIHGKIIYSNHSDVEIIWLNSKNQTLKVIIFDERNHPVRALNLMPNRGTRVPAKGYIERIG